MAMDIDIDGLNHFSAKVKTVADRDYYHHEQYGFLPKKIAIEGQEWGGIEDSLNDWGTVGGMITLASLKQKYGDDAHIKIAEEVHNNTSFDQFSFLAHTEHALVFLGKSDTELGVLRVSAHPNSPLGSRAGNREDCTRPHFQGVLQGRADPLSVDGILQIELLPLVITGTLPHAEKVVFNNYLKSLVEGTCYSADVGVSEFAILPDGMAMGLDPSDVNYRPEFWGLNPKQQLNEELRSLSIITDRLLNTPKLPEGVKWVDDDGVNKQYRIYPDLQKPSLNLDHLLAAEI